MREQWQSYIRDFGKVLRAENKSQNTITLYLGTAETFLDWLEENDRLKPVEDIGRHDVGDWAPMLTETGRQPRPTPGTARSSNTGSFFSSRTRSSARRWPT